MFLEDYFNSSETNLNDITCYRVVLNILDSKQNYSKDRYIELIKNISTNIDNNNSQIFQELDKLITVPKNVSQILFLFVGTVNDSSIITILDYIKINKQIKKSDIPVLNSYFNYNVEEVWNINYRENLSETQYLGIYFIFKTISNTETINYLYNIISSEITSTLDKSSFKIVANYNTISLFSKNEISIDTRIQEIIQNIQIEYKNKGYRFTLVTLKNKLFLLNIPEIFIDNLFKKYSNDIINIYSILKDVNLLSLIEHNLKFKMLEHDVKYRDISVINSCYLPQYFINDEDYINNFIDINQNIFKIDYINSKNFIGNITNDNTIYIYSLYNLLSIKDNNKINEIDIDVLYGICLKKFFPKINNEYLDSVLTINENEKQEIIELSNSFNYYNITNETFNAYKLSIDSNIKISIVRNLILNFVFYIKLPLHFELRNIFNSFKLDDSVPFVKYKDKQDKEIIYKIFKPVTQRLSDEYLPEVDKDTLDSWIKYKNDIFESFKIKKIKSNPNELIYKIKIDQINNDVMLTNGEIIEIRYIENEIVCDIKSNEVIYSNINSKNIYGDTTVGSVVSFNNYVSLYANLEIHKSGKISVNYDISKYNQKTENFNNFIIENLINKINIFLKKMFSLEKTLSSYKSFLNLINTKLFLENNINNDKLNLSYQFSLVNQIPFTYQKLTEILNNLYPIVSMISPIYNMNEAVLYYDDSKSEWIDSEVISIQSDTENINNTEYTLKINYKSNIIQKSGIKHRYIKKKDNDTDRSIIKFHLKKVPFYDETKTVKYYIIKYNSLGYDKQLIIEKIMEQFQIDKNTTLKQVTKTLSVEGIHSIDNIEGDMYPIVSIDYLKKKKGDFINSDIYIENIPNMFILNYTIKFLYFCIDIYNKINTNSLQNNDYLDLYIKYQNELGVERISEIQNDNQNKIEETSSPDIYQISDDEQEDDFFDTLLDDDDDLIDETTENIEESRELLLKNLEKEIQEDTILIGQKRQNKNIVLDRLISADSELFSWDEKKTGKAPYTRGCQAISRYPKVFTDAEKQKIDERDTNFFQNHYQNPNMRSYNTKNTDNSNCFDINSLPKKTNKDGKSIYDCSAIKYGTVNVKDNWYTCPKIYDIIDNVPLHWKMLDYIKLDDGSSFQPVDEENIELWRTDKKTGKDILEFNPTYKGRTVIPSKIEKIDATDKQSLLLTEKDNLYSYPGVLKPNTHPSGIYQSPCCFKGQSKNIENIFSLQSKDSSDINGYIQNWGKDLGFSPQRIGLLPDKLSELLNVNNKLKCTTGEMSIEKKGFYRSGVKQGNESFLNMMSNIYGTNQLNDLINKNIKDFIVRKCTLDLFKNLNNGLLDINFRNYGKQSSYQNYLEYTLSNELKEYEFFYQILTIPDEQLLYSYKDKRNIKDVAIIIFDIDENNDINILCPSFCNFCNDKLTNITHICLSIKNNQSFEPIYYYNGHVSSRVKLFPLDDKSPRGLIINQIYNSFKSNCNQKRKISDLFLVSQHLGIPSFNEYYTFDDVIEAFKNIQQKKNVSLNNYLPKYLLVDNYNKIFGMFLHNNAIIPIYPIAISYRYYNEIHKMFGVSYTIPSLVQGGSKYIVTNLKNHLDTYQFFNQINPKIDIKPIYYFHENEFITGFVTNVGSHINIQKEKISKQDNLIANNYDMVDDQIKMFQTALFNSVYVKPINFYVLADILSLINIENSIDDYEIVKYIKKQSTNQVQVIITKNNIIIPIQLVDVSVIIEKYPNIKIGNFNNDVIINNIEDFINSTIILCKKSNYSIPIIPQGTIMNIESKKIDKIILNSGFEIPLSESQKFSIDTYSFDLNTYKLNLFMDISFQNKLNSTLDIENLIDLKRLKIISKLSYEENIYQAIQFVMYKLFQNEQLEIVKEYVNNILVNILLNDNFKVIILLPIIQLLVDYLTYQEKDIPDIYPKLNLDNIGNFDKCIGTHCIYIENIELLNKDIDEYIWSIIELSGKYNTLEIINELLLNFTDKKSSNFIESKNLLLEIFKKKLNIKQIEFLNQSLEIYNYLTKNLNDNYCKLKVILNNQDINKINYKLTNDIIKNNLIKNQIFKIFKIIGTHERYINTEDEIIIFNKELSDKNFINKLYHTIKKSYYRVLTHFDQIDYKVNLSSLQNKSIRDKSIENCKIKYHNTCAYSILAVEKKLINTSIKKNIVKLSIIEYEKLSQFIFKLNTKLTKKKIILTQICNYNIFSSKTKLLKFN